jgi:hypothetical protein
MPYRNKTYVCFDGDTDMSHYRMMQAWNANEKIDFGFYNAHDLNSARDSSQTDSIKRQLRERLNNSKLFIVLIGEKTWRLTRFVQWEMEAALKLDLPIIGVNLDGSRQQSALCPSAIKEELAIHVPYGRKIMQYAIDNWPDSHKRHRTAGTTGARWYKDEVYKGLGL